MARAVPNDTHEPMCVSDSLEKVIEFLDELCGYPDQSDRDDIERYECQVKIPYIGIIRYQNKFLYRGPQIVL